jgi:hypothetical protein
MQAQLGCAHFLLSAIEKPPWDLNFQAAKSAYQFYHERSSRGPKEAWTGRMALNQRGGHETEKIGR